VQCVDRFRVVRHHFEQGMGSPGGAGAAMLPVLQGAQVHAKAFGKLATPTHWLASRAAPRPANAFEQLADLLRIYGPRITTAPQVPITPFSEAF
jgi:hypothetical protein